MKKIFGSLALSILFLACTAASAQQFGPWSAPMNLGPTVNTASDDMHPTLSKDGLSLIFSSTRPGGAGGIDLWVSQRDSLDSPWQTPQNITALNSPYDDHAPNLTTDGHWLFFFSTRPDGCNTGGRQELWAAHRQNKRDDFGWEPPINLGCTLNVSGADDGGPNFWEDDSTGILYLYFARNLTPANPNGFDIYVSTCTSDLDSCNRQQLWGPGALVAELSSPQRDTRSAIRRRDGLEMILSTTRAGGVGGQDLWVSTRASAQDLWSIPINVNQDNLNDGGDAVINTAANESAPALSWDGQTMIFYSNRAGGHGGNDLYMSTRQKLKGQQ
jgi:WD40-like Beta Propeller Repeat